MTLHKEGKKIILAVLVFTVVAVAIINLFFPKQTVWHCIAYLFLSCNLLITIRFFRVPNRLCNHQSANHALSVCDGTVVVIEEVYEKEYFKDKRMLISVFMSIHDVHINWFPLSGKIGYVKYHPGKKLIAKHPKSSEENERTTIVIKTENDKEILVRQIAGTVARRVVCYAENGKTAIQGEELGFIKFGSRIDHYLPLDADIKVALKQKVKGKQTILAQL
jgi:phosphatidylserine decarboxylase